LVDRSLFLSAAIGEAEYTDDVEFLNMFAALM